MAPYKQLNDFSVHRPFTHSSHPTQHQPNKRNLRLLIEPLKMVSMKSVIGESIWFREMKVRIWRRPFKTSNILENRQQLYLIKYIPSSSGFSDVHWILGDHQRSHTNITATKEQNRTPNISFSLSIYHSVSFEEDAHIPHNVFCQIPWVSFWMWWGLWRQCCWLSSHRGLAGGKGHGL